MKDMLKTPIFYCILIPVLVGMWPLLVRAYYLQHAQEQWEDQKEQFEEFQEIIPQILELDPERLDYEKNDKDAAEFDYAVAIEQIATLCKIPSSAYRLSSSIVTRSGKQKSQSASVSLEDIDITRFAKFLSAIQLRWSNLQCERLKLTKQQGEKDSWDIDLELKYYY